MKTVKIQFVDMPMEFDVNDNFILTTRGNNWDIAVN